jgi:hypothetical protein
MGTIRKKNNGYEAAVFKLGIRKSRTCRTKAEANIWITETEKEILAGKFNVIPDKTFGDLMDRYGKQVSPTKRGASFELKRISKLAEDPISEVKLSELNQTHFAEWRDRRLQKVTAGTVFTRLEPDY